MNEEIVKELLKSNKLSLGQAVGKAKRIWSASKKVTTYTDGLTNEEQNLFSDDYYLAGLVMEKSLVDERIKEHIEETVTAFRNATIEAKRTAEKDSAKFDISRYTGKVIYND